MVLRTSSVLLNLIHLRLSQRDCPKSGSEGEDMKLVPYAPAVGSLMYAMVATRCRENPSLCADRETEPLGFWTRRIKCSNMQHKQDINLRQIGETNHSFISK